MIRITAACPLAMISDCNNYAMAIAYGPADGETYRLPCGWQDHEGNLYSAASWEASEQWIQSAQQPLVRPEWDLDQIVDMVAAARAQSAMVFSMEPIAASVTKLTAIGGMSGPDALAAMGLTLVEEPDAE
jgi:hypothetical protein